MVATMKRPDADLKQEVLTELKWDTRVKETEVGVEVDKGVVTLSGIVSSYAKKLAALEAAHRVHGVLDVANDIQVRVPSSLARTDTEIAQAVRQALEWNVLIQADHIRSTVEQGWVTLEGEVVSLRERLDAEKAVNWLAGVRGLTNQLQVKSPEIEPVLVIEAIQAALARDAQLEAQRIKVTVRDGRVTLYGHVRSAAERQAIVEAATHAPGVVAVDDRIYLDRR